MSLGDEADVVLEFERGGNVVERYEIPWRAWEGFKIVAARQGKSARDYLTILLGCGMAEGETVGEMIHWLFAMPSEPSPVRRFEQAAAEFHGQEVAA